MQHTKTFLIFVTLFLTFGKIISQTKSPCELVAEPKAFQDCSPFINATTQTICCFIRGVYGGNNGTACLPVDALFKEKTISLSIDGLSSSMICGDKTDSGSLISLSYSYIVYIFLFLLI